MLFKRPLCLQNQYLILSAFTFIARQLGIIRWKTMCNFTTHGEEERDWKHTSLEKDEMIQKHCILLRTSFLKLQTPPIGLSLKWLNHDLIRHNGFITRVLRMDSWSAHTSIMNYIEGKNWLNQDPFYSCFPKFLQQALPYILSNDKMKLKVFQNYPVTNLRNNKINMAISSQYQDIYSYTHERK